MPVHDITKEQYIANPCRVSSLAYWKNNSFSLPKNMQVLHEKDFDANVANAEVTKYFRLFYDFSCKNVFHSLNEKYYFEPVNIAVQLETVCEIINLSYEDISVSLQQVLSWTKQRVFDKELWVLVYEKTSSIPVALGIADFDYEVKEGSLEWIQVLPQYRGQGIAAALVTHLLSNLKPKANFVTVSGQVDNKTNPQSLYKKCGFKGNDIWVIKKSSV